MTPKNNAKAVCVSNYSEKLIEKLSEFKIEPIITVNSPFLESRINYHTDMLLNVINDTVFIDKSQKDNFVNFLTKGYRLKILNREVCSPYPNDSVLNCVTVGNSLICNQKTVSQDLLNYAVNLGYNILPVNQGYTKCSICVVNDNALITDDLIIHNIASSNQIDSILISKGSVQLKGFDYGFIGGCSGLISKNKLLFNGDINYHKDCNRILDFLNKYNVEPIIIESEPLVDIGSIIPLFKIS